MKKFRNSITVCSVLALGFAVAGVVTFNTTVVDSITAGAATATVASFEVSDGASVRIKEGSNGIRFETKISDAYYEELQTEFSTGTFTFYTVINRAENPVEADAEIYEHTVNANSFVDGYATYYSAIKYDNLTEQELAVASGIELSAKAYVEIAVVGQETIKREATAEDTVRSMRSVANLALLSGDYTNNSTATTQLETYLGTITRNETVAYVETDAERKALTLANATEGMDVYLNGKNTGLTVGAEGAVDYSSLDLSDYTLGDYLYISAFNDDNDVVSAKARYVTQAIETEAELRETLNVLRKQTYAGKYYVLANNIDCTSTDLLGDMETYGRLCSTFDGQGYYVNNLYVGRYGIFGKNIGTTGKPAAGTLKNIAFTNVNSTVDNPILIGTGNEKTWGRIDNVYVSATCDGLRLYQNTHTAYDNWGYFNAVVLENCAGVYAGNSGATGTISTNSLYMISAEETPVAANRYATNTTKTGVEMYGYLEDNMKYGGIYWFASYELMADANISSTATASAPTIAYFNDCWNLKKGYPVWENMPAKVIAITAKQYVEQPSSEYGTDTAAGYSELVLSGVQDVTVSVSINGGTATEMNVSNGSVQIAWTAFANAGVVLGQTVPMLVKASDGTTWIFNEVMYVTQAIETEAEFRAVCNVLRSQNYTGMYFVLANNIECTSKELLGDSQTFGHLVSTFDGQGYYVNNLCVGEYGIFGENVGNNGKRGILKNIAFTNVDSTKASPILLASGICNHNNLSCSLDNVYVSAACDGLTLYGNAKTITVGPAFSAVILKDCAGVYSGDSASIGYFLSTNSLYMISAEETPVAANRYATNTTQSGVNTYTYDTTDAKRGGMYWFESYETMKAANISSTATASAPTIAYFNDCWDLENGYPVWKNLPKA